MDAVKLRWAEVLCSMLLVSKYLLFVFLVVIQRTVLPASIFRSFYKVGLLQIYCMRPVTLVSPMRSGEVK